MGNNEAETERSINPPSLYRNPASGSSQLGCSSVCNSSKHERRTAKAAIPWMDIFTLCLCALLHLRGFCLLVCFSLPRDLGEPSKKACVLRDGARINIWHVDDLGHSIVLAYLIEPSSRQLSKPASSNLAMRSNYRLCGRKCLLGIMSVSPTIHPEYERTAAVRLEKLSGLVATGHTADLSTEDHLRTQHEPVSGGYFCFRKLVEEWIESGSV